jgi:tRNA dimethylallyltransferase
MTDLLPVIVIAGPTAVGKTSIAVELAERIGGEIIGADSRQIYRGFDIGTGKPSAEERTRVPHHLIDVADPREVFSAARFAAMAAERIGLLDMAGKRTIVVGGTGLYLRALQSGLFPAPRRDDDLRERLRQRALSEGTASLHAELAQVDPEAAGRIHPNDSVRIIRALEVFEGTGFPISRLQREETASPLPGRRFTGILLVRPSAELDQRIARRVRAMADAGWAEEVRRLLASGCDRECPGMQSLGYRTMARVADGEIGIEEAVETIVRETRRYAKRQVTWFRGDRSHKAVEPGERDDATVLEELLRIAREEER